MEGPGPREGSQSQGERQWGPVQKQVGAAEVRLGEAMGAAVCGRGEACERLLPVPREAGQGGPRDCCPGVGGSKPESRSRSLGSRTLSPGSQGAEREEAGPEFEVKVSCVRVSSILQRFRWARSEACRPLGLCHSPLSESSHTK